MWYKRIEKLPTVSLSLDDFVNKPPSLIMPSLLRPPLEGPKLNKLLSGRLKRALTVLTGSTVTAKDFQTPERPVIL